MKKIIILIATLLIFYILGVLLVSFRVLPNTKLDNNKIGMYPKATLSETLDVEFASQKLEITDDVITDYEPNLTDIGVTFDSQKLANDIKANQKPLLWPYQIFTQASYQTKTYITTSEEVVREQLTTNFVTSDKRISSENASSYYDENDATFKIKDEVYGNQISDEFISTVIDNLNNGQFTIDATAYYKKPKITKEDLQPNITLLNDRLDTPVSAVFGAETVTIPREKVATFIFLNDDGELDVDNTKLYNYLQAKAEEFTSVNTTSASRIVTMYDIDSAYYQIENGLLDTKSTNIVGTASVTELKQDPRQTSLPTSSTYIEVSISDQNMWLYNDGKLVAQTPVVTGTVSLGRDTPTGTFSVWNKETDKVLNGASVGYDYQIPVDYWMAIDYTGVGIHDADYFTSATAANYRSAYLTNGSHGCVNTPNDVMKTFYDNTPLGTPVYVMP